MLVLLDGSTAPADSGNSDILLGGSYSGSSDIFAGWFLESGNSDIFAGRFNNSCR